MQSHPRELYHPNEAHCQLQVGLCIRSPLKTAKHPMALNQRRDYFISATEVVLKSRPRRGAKPNNHLILGDWLRWLGETDGDWEKVRCRGDEGWIRRDEFGSERALEVNFVDIGQGDGCHIVTPKDEVILIDAGVGSNMNRFLSWRYNLRSRNVRRAPDFDDSRNDLDPFLIDHVIISHPDNDHYYGLLDVFKNLKLKFKKIYHNGIVERPNGPQDPKLKYPSGDDLGGYTKDTRPSYLWNIADTNKKLKTIVEDHPTTQKQFLKTIRAAISNTRSVRFDSVSRRIEKLDSPVHLGPYDDTRKMKLEVLGPLTEKVKLENETRRCLRKLGSEGVTKNGHSIVLKLTYGKLKVMLGGDLNTQSQDFLLRQYTAVNSKASTLEKKVAKLEAKGASLTDSQTTSLEKAREQLSKIVDQAREAFQCDVTKACHHGSAHFTDTFVKAINATATVISSGDSESHSHPRPDALGAFGKHGRGHRPLIFSTELARSTREFTPVIKFLEEVRAFEAELAAESDPQKRKEIEQKMEARRDRNVAIYGMITLRALGDKVIIAQKLEVPRNEGTKWDIYELAYNKNTEVFEYAGH
jgi:beta-lactamase superfamily II metal-dependent hydrolase